MARKQAKFTTSVSRDLAAPEPAASAVDELVRSGLRAIEEYDYELARTDLTRALDISGGAETPARALLGLLVDHLGADHEALALGEHLSREALASPSVRSSLALAAARCGDHPRARTLLARIDGSPAAEVLVVLAAAALASGELDEATRLCDEARSHDSGHFGAQEMARRIARAREESRRPLEDEIILLREVGELDEAARLAETVLTRFPESEVARRTLRAASEVQQTRAAERAIAAAEEALAQADPILMDASRHAARIALAAAPANEALAGRLAALDAGASARELAAKVGDVVRLLTEGDPRVGLTRYSSLPAEPRRRVREATRLPILDDLEHLLGKRTAASDAVDALLAFSDAAASADRDPERALQTLAAHERALAGLTAASRLTARIQQRLRDDRRRALSELLGTARAALDGGDAARVLELLGSEGFRELEPAEREVAEALRASARSLLETAEIEASYHRRLQAGDPLGAREAAGRLLARAGETERARRQDQIDAATAAARRAFGVWASESVVDAETGQGMSHTVELGAPLRISALLDDALPWVDPEGRSLIALECCDHWLFIHAIDLATARVRARVVIRTPEPLSHPMTTMTATGTLLVSGDRGALLEISLETWDPLSWRSLDDIFSAEIIDDLEVAPGARFAWVNARRDDRNTRVQVVDLERWRVVRELPEGWWFQPVVGADEPTMAHSRRASTVSLHHPGGAMMERGVIELPADIRSLLVHPAAGRWLAFVGEDDDMGERLGFVEIGADGVILAPEWLDDVSSERSWVSATSRTHRTSYLVAHARADGEPPALHMFSAERTHLSLRRVHRVPLPTFARLAQDPVSRRVLALLPEHERLHVIPLGAEPPVIPSCEPEPPRAVLPDLGFGCNVVSRASEGHHASIQQLQQQPERAAMAWMRRKLAAAGENIVELLDAHDALHSASHATIADELLRWMREHRPADPHVALIEAEALARAERWTEVRQRLEGVDLRAILASRRQHAYHLLGLALAREGESERAAALLHEGLRASDGRCQLDTLLAAVEPLPASSLHDTPPRSPLHALREAVRDADAGLLRGDLAAARAAIDRRLVWEGAEVQSLARLAAVELLAEPESDVEKFRKALALARFLDAHRESAGFRRELPLRTSNWPARRIAELETRAQGWLERLGAPDEPPAPLLTLAEVLAFAGDEHTEAVSRVEVPRAEEAPHTPVHVSAAGSPVEGMAPATAAGEVAAPTALDEEVSSTGVLTPVESATHVEPTARAEFAGPAWSQMLRELGAALDALATDPSPRAPARLAFRVRHAGRTFEAIEPLLQRSLRGGRFSAGQTVTAGELAAIHGQLTDDVDAAAVVVLTEGAAPSSRSRAAPSWIRMQRLLGVLVGHPRVFLADRPTEPVKVMHGRLGVELVEGLGGLELRFLVGGAPRTADELLAHAETSTVIDVDSESGIITVVPLTATAQALAGAQGRHRPVFPEESHDALLRQLGALQHAVDLRLPIALSGELCEADSRPVVRLTPLEDAGLLVEIGVRPAPGMLFGPPGEGSIVALGSADGLRVSARRDHARERAAAEGVLQVLGLDAVTREGKWRHRVVGEEAVLAVVEALAELGAEVVVEWPKDARAWRWLGKVTRKELRVRIAHRHDLLQLEGEVEIEGHRVALALLLEALAQGRRYVIVGPGMFVAIAAELRERLDAARDLLWSSGEGLAAGLAAAPVLADLAGEGPTSDAAWHALRERTTCARTLDPALPAALRAELRPYQREGFRWLTRLAAWGTGACLADDMGLGKTLQALALLAHRAALGPALVIAPASVTPGWLTECGRFTPDLHARPYRGTDRRALLFDVQPGDVLVAGYDVVTRDADTLADVQFATLVLDEAQVIKNTTTRRARAVARLQADFRVALTGTPVENHLGELWSLYRVISPGLLGTWTQFRERFAAPIERDGNAERRTALARVLRPFLLRRTKEAVLPELPPLIEVERFVGLKGAERELYETARLAAATAIAGAEDPRERFAVLGWLTRLRRLACHPRLFDETWTGGSSKLAAFLALVEELREAGHRALVFSQFTDHLAVVREALGARGISFAYLDGSTPVDQRARVVDAFQRGTDDLFLISLKAGGTGLNLTAADHVIHLDPWWNPAVEDQATDRAHRIGQTRPVTVVRLIARGTIEEAVLALHAEKRELAEQLLAGTDTVGRLSADALVELVRRGTSSEDAEASDEDELEACEER